MLRRLLREYLSLSRTERRGMQVLCLLIVLLVIARASMPRLIRPAEPDVSLFSEGFIAFQDSLLKLDARLADRTGRAQADTASASGHVLNGGESRCAGLFPFDPNTAGFDDLIRLGLPSGIAGILLKFRVVASDNGHKSSNFSRNFPEDFREMFRTFSENVLKFFSP